MDSAMGRFYAFLVVLVILLFAITFAMGGVSRNIGPRAAEDLNVGIPYVESAPFEVCTLSCSSPQGKAAKSPAMVPRSAFITVGNVFEYSIVYPPVEAEKVDYALESGFESCTINKKGVLMAKSSGTCTVRSDIINFDGKKILSLYSEVTVMPFPDLNS